MDDRGCCLAVAVARSGATIVQFLLSESDTVGPKFKLAFKRVKISDSVTRHLPSVRVTEPHLRCD